MRESKSSFSRFKLRMSALLGAAVLFTPAAVMGQTPSTDQAFLNDLYPFLQSNGPLAHDIAKQTVTDEGNVWAAKSFCQDMANGAKTEDIYNTFVEGTFSSVDPNSGYTDAEIAYTAGLYIGSIMNFGSAYYCPTYTDEVIQALQAL